MLEKLGNMFRAATELPRGMLEYREFQRRWPEVRNRLPEGDGRAVLVIPGFGLDDFYMAPLRDALREKGFKVYEWEGGINFGFDKNTARHLRRHVERIYRRHNEDRAREGMPEEKISIVGYSLGGIYARELKRELPCWVDKAVTMGTPFGHSKNDRFLLNQLRKIYRLLNPQSADFLNDQEVADRFVTPPGEGTVSIFSAADGVAGWRSSLNPRAPKTFNIEVSSSHAGMPWNVQAVVAAIDTLSQETKDLKEFNPRKYPFLKWPKTLREEDLPNNPGWHYRKTKRPPMFRHSR